MGVYKQIRMIVMKYMVSLFLAFVLMNVANAELNGFTMHSRANCGNNESISWDATQYRVLGTVGHHYHNGTFIHRFSTGWENTWRSASVHWFEANPGSGWRVVGFHWIKVGTEERLLEVTDVSDCSIYDGWWSK